MKTLKLIVLLLVLCQGNMFSQVLGYTPNHPSNNFGSAVQSGLYMALNPTGFVTEPSHEWKHFFTIRHSNTSNNHQFQIATTYAENDRVFFRKIAGVNNGIYNPTWFEFATRGTNTFSGNQVFNSGNVGIGITPECKLDVNGDISVRNRLFNYQSGYSPNNLNSRFTVSQFLTVNSKTDYWLTACGKGSNASNIPDIVFGFYNGTNTKEWGRFGKTGFELTQGWGDFIKLRNTTNANYWAFVNPPGQDQLGLVYRDVNNNQLLNILNVSATNGNVGIGTSSLLSRLHVYSNTSSTALTIQNYISYINQPTAWQFENNGNSDLVIKNNTGSGAFTSRMVLKTDGKLCLNTTNVKNNAQLTVKGKIVASEIEILDVTQIPDYVFEADYKLRSLADVESFIQANKHLPEVPSAKEVESNGMNMAEMNKALLLKVEELTLYMIQQDKAIKNLESKIETLTNK